MNPVALVTGSGAARVGRAIAVRLAHLGCRLALHANSSLQEAEQAAHEIQQACDTEVIVTQGSLAEDDSAEGPYPPEKRKEFWPVQAAK